MKICTMHLELVQSYPLVTTILSVRIPTVTPQAAQAHYVWVRASEVIWSEYTRIISVLSDAK